MRASLPVRPLALAGLLLPLGLPVVLPSTSLATEVLIFAIAALGCNLLLGYAGLLSFGQAIFFGGGSYATALLMIHAGAGLVTGLIGGMATGVVLALLVGSLSILRSGIYFVMLTLAFSQMFYFVAYAMSGITGGENGLLDVPRPPLDLIGLPAVALEQPFRFYLVVWLAYALLFLLFQRVIMSPFGSVLVAIRENEERARALGYNTQLYKLVAFLLSGLATGLAGGLYAMFLHFVPLSNADVAMSERILIMTIIGGTGSLLGSVLGAGVFVVLSDILSELWPRWLLLLGLVLIALVLYMRGGLWEGFQRFGLLLASPKNKEGKPKAWERAAE